VFRDMAMICDTLNVAAQKLTNPFYFNLAEEPLGQTGTNKEREK